MIGKAVNVGEVATDEWNPTPALGSAIHSAK